MQELRFVGLEDDWLIATNENGDRFRLRADESLREALRPRPAARPEGPRVPPRQIQQLIRAGRTVEEVVEQTGADAETVARFEGPILAERGYIVEQARAVGVRLQPQIDPLSRDGATFGSTIDDRLEQLGASEIHWDAWKDPETGWHVGLDFITEDVARNALWNFDPRSHTLQPASPAAITLSQQGEPTALMGPHLRAVKREPTDRVIPVDNLDDLGDAMSPQDHTDLTTHETEDLLEALRRRRGERQHATYDEEAEFAFDDNDASVAVEDQEEASSSRVTPFARPVQQDAASEPAEASSEPLAPASADSADLRPHQVPLGNLEPEPAGRGQRGKMSRKRGGRPSMPSWDEIVFGTKGDDD
ncbi:septation protein SepH [Gulosibacter chungangensis]|uniref:DUF3071 domain-containing protein n=1 Tax=Gulosibacter chungangensis TaxID=979746 RepID=A0A7J5BCT9_9MICO|nr:septation protein SepH [Gulosibacter chungangensis]KAB1644027.1 DUF3071 domain-containing protein [Gulosibacter chungangensis]